MAAHSPEYSDDEFDFDEEYFSRTYQPLSNLPTPPPSSRESLADQSPRALLEDGGLLDSALLGPAIHLVNLVPPAASLTAPSVPLVHEMLVRADLPLDAIALAVCILDSLNSKFPLNWRLLCPLAPAAHEPTNKRHTIQLARPPPPGAAAAATPQLHIDAVGPEVIILAALVIAFKFVADCHEPTAYYRSAWGSDLWTSEQLNVTERCVMESLGYRILPLWDPVLIADAVDDMQRAGRQAALRRPQQQQQQQQQQQARTGGEAHKRSASSAVVLSGQHYYQQRCNFLPLTPVETPVLENAPTLTPVREVAGMDGFGEEEASLVGVEASMLHLPPQQLPSTERKTILPAACEEWLTRMGAEQ